MSPHTLRDSPSTWLPPCPVQHPQTYGSAQASEGAKQDSCNISIQWGLVGESSLISSSYLPFRLIRHELLCNRSLSAAEMSIIGHFPGWDCHKNPPPFNLPHKLQGWFLATSLPQMPTLRGDTEANWTYSLNLGLKRCKTTPIHVAW